MTLLQFGKTSLHSIAIPSNQYIQNLLHSRRSCLLFASSTNPSSTAMD